MPLELTPQTAAFAQLLRQGSIDVIFDHDGTLMDSGFAEASRIHQALAKFMPKSHSLNVQLIQEMGYGRNGLWLKELLHALKISQPSLELLIDEHSDAIYALLDVGLVDDSIISMGMLTEELAGTAEFIRCVLDHGNDIAVFSANWDEVVYMGLNRILARVNVRCASPRVLDERAKHYVASLNVSAQYEFSMNANYGQHLDRKPKPDGLLMENFLYYYTRSESILGANQQAQTRRS